MTATPPSLAPDAPALDWSRAAAPRSITYDDVYYSAVDGLAEARAVFLDGCGLPDGWRRQRQFVLGELGFGAGLNLLATWDLWRRTKAPGALLHYVSVEGAPLTGDALRRAHAPFIARDAGLARLSAALAARLPPRIKGVHRRRFDDDGLVVTLAYLPVAEALAHLELTADAWFLDGFAPARNPAMWSPPTVSAIAARSRPGARAATYTVAGAVRRGLEAVGFRVTKRPGFGSKRERLEAVFEGDAAHAHDGRALTTPADARAAPPDSAIVIGAGLAGACAAQALARRGVAVTVLEAGPGPAHAASGNPIGLVTPRLDRDDRPAARFHRSAYAFALDCLDGDDAFTPCGVAQIATDAGERAKLEGLLSAKALPATMADPLTPDTAAAAGAPGAAGLFLPHAGTATPRAIVQRALAHADVRADAAAASVEPADGGWIARAHDRRILAAAETCVLACGTGLARFEQSAFMPLPASRGQLSWATLKGAAPVHALTFGGYAAPFATADGLGLVFGATYDPWPHDALVRADHDSDARNHALLAQHAPDLAGRIEPAAIKGRAALRATTPDRLPYLGPAPVEADFRAQFADLAVGGAAGTAPARLHDGLSVFGGLGSRGLSWAPLLAEALASAVCGEPGALERGAAEALHPARALVRALKRGR